MLLAFGQFELDLATSELKRDGRVVRLQPRVFELLRYLVEHRDRVVSQRELIEALWDGPHLNPVAVQWSVSHARRALGERGGARRFIATIRGRGYRFIAPVEQVATGNDEQAKLSSRPPCGPPSTRSEPPFTGREQVLSLLTTALDSARGGRGRLYLLTGEPGIGKTRCTDEVSALARRGDAHVFVGRCIDSGGAPAFWPWIQVLRACAAETGLAQRARDDAAALARRLTSPAGSPFDAGPGPADTSSSARFWLLDSLITYLRRASQKKPCVVVLDDLHRADEASVEALALLAPQLKHTHLLVLATVRTGPGALAARGAELVLRLEDHETIALSGLLRPEVASCLQHVLGRPPPSELTRAVHRRTAGNPLFLREALRLLALQLARGESPRAETIRLPLAARGLLEQRLAAVDDATRRVLDAASVMGDELELPVLQRVLDISVEELLARLDDAVEAHVLELSSPGERHLFTHGLWREVLYEDLPSLERVRLHARVGLALEELSAVEPRWSELAHHFHHALPEDHYERAARYARLAGDEAMRVFAYEDAARLYGWALSAHQLLERSTAREACDLMLRRATAMHRAGQRKRWRADCEQAIALASKHELPEQLIEAAQLLRPTVFFARMPNAAVARALEEALALLPDTAKAPRSKALSLLACLPPHANSLTASRRLSAEALELARELGEGPPLLDALEARLYGLRNADTNQELLRTAGEILERNGERVSWLAAQAHLACYHARLERGDADAEQSLEAFGALVRRLRLPRIVWHHDRLRAQSFLARGELDRAEKWFEQLWQQSQRLRLGGAWHYYAAQMNALCLERTGRCARTERGEPAPAWLEAVPGYRVERLMRLAVGQDSAAARSELSAFAANGFAEVLDDQASVHTLTRLAQAAVVLQARDEAAALLEVLGPYAGFNAVHSLFFCAGAVDHFLGLLCHLLDRRCEAEAHFEAALALNSRLGYQARVATTRLALAELLWSAKGKRRRARTLATRAAADAERLGLAGTKADAARLLGA